MVSKSCSAGRSLPSGGHSHWALEQGAGDGERLRGQASRSVKGGSSMAASRPFLTNGRSGSAGLPKAPDAPRPAGESWARGESQPAACALWELDGGSSRSLLSSGRIGALAPAVR